MSAVARIGRADVVADATLGAAFDREALLSTIDARTRALLARRRTARRRFVVRRGLLLADLLGFAFAFVAARAITGGSLAAALGLDAEVVLFAAALPVWLLVGQSQGLYDRDYQRADHATADDVVGVFHLVTIGAWTLLAASLLSGLAQPELTKLIAFWAIAICLVPLGRTVARGLARRSSAYLQNTLIVGAGDVGQLIARKLLRHPEYGINLVGFVDRHPKVRREDLPEHLTMLGPPECLPEIVRALDVERVIVAFSNEPASETLRCARMLQGTAVQVDLVPHLFELVGPHAGVHSVEGLPLVGLPAVHMAPASRIAKRLFDVVVAGGMLLSLAPLFAYIALRIRRDSPGPVFFRQTRIGAGGRQFTALKFRTMKVDVDTSVHREYVRASMDPGAVAAASGIFKLDRSDAVTNIGRLLRKTSLDELPQLINVLKGDMSIVGPRPCIPYELELFKPHHFERLLVPQGLTGLWQVTARAHSSFGEALDMDVAYVRGWSLGLDLKLALRTPLQLLRQRSATA